MMKSLFLCGFLAFASAAFEVSQPQMVEFSALSPKLIVQKSPNLNKAVDVGGGLECQLCVQEVVALINVVLNDILNGRGGIINDCSKLCDPIKNNKTKGFCTLACDLVGIKKLIQLLNSTDPDEIYICGEIKLCALGNCTGHGDGSSCLAITSTSVQPPIAKVNDPVNVLVDIDVLEPLSTGMTRIQVHFPPLKNGKPGQVQQTDTLNVNWPAGKGQLTVQIPAETTDVPGNYTVSVQICEGSCGSDKPDSSTYDIKDATFEAVDHVPPSPPPPPPAPGSNPWADPNSGPCPNGEQAVQVNGVAGSFCSPPCSGTTCPGAPTGVTATPQCVLEKSGTTTPNMCALVCGGGLSCPAKASCKSIQNTGICTFDS